MKLKTETKKKFVSMPHTYVLLFYIIVIVAILTYIIPAGEYDRVFDEKTNRTIVDPDSFQWKESSPVNLFGVFKAIPKGMSEASTISFFLLIVAGSFQIINTTGTVEAGIYSLAKALKGKEHLVIPIFMFTFSLTGAFLGFSEENMVFIPVAIALSRALGYDAIVGMSLISIGGVCGFYSAMMNPFTVGTAQGIAELPLFSGIGLRFVLWAVLLITSTAYIMRYANKVRENPELSLIKDVENLERGLNSFDLNNQVTMNSRHYLIFITIIGGFIAIVFGVYKYGWYINEIAALFLLMGVISGIIGKIKPNDMAKEFINGARGIIFGALVVGIARAILVVMQQGGILDTIVYGLASAVISLPSSLSAVGMYVIQTIINCFIPSGTGQAAATMPIMVPLADILGITRQTTVLAYQLGGGFGDSIIPTASTLMASLSLSKIPYGTWLKYIGKLVTAWFIIGAIFMIIADKISYGPF